MTINVLMRKRYGEREKGCAVCGFRLWPRSEGRDGRPIPLFIGSYFDVVFSERDGQWHDYIELCGHHGAECAYAWLREIYGDDHGIDVVAFRDDRGEKTLALPDIDDYKRLLIWCRAGQ